MDSRNQFHGGIRFYQWLLLLFASLAFVACGSRYDTDTGNNKKFDSGRIEAGATFSHTFNNTGTVEYYCEIHKPDMQGKVHVEEGASKSGQVTVQMENNQFNPKEITVTPGTTVEWVNNDGHDHTVISGNPDTDGGNGGGGYY